MSSLITWAPFSAVVLPMWTMLSPWSKQSHGCSCQGCKATNHTGTLRNLPNPASGAYTNTRPNSSEHSGTFQTLPPEPTPKRAGTLQNPPEPSGTNLSEPSGTYLRNLRQHTPEPWTFWNLPTPEPSGTFWNPPPELTPAYTGTLNLLEPAYAGTFRNLLEPASGTYASTCRNSPEPSSGTCSCDPHRHTPELIWAEDPISLRCWGKRIGRQCL